MRLSGYFVLLFSFSLTFVSPVSAEPKELADLREAYEYHAKRGYYRQALPLATRQLELAESLYVRPHPEIARAMLDLGKCHVELGYDPKQGDVGFGDYERARSYLQQALEMRRALYGPDNADVAEVLEALSDLAVRQNEGGKAEALAREALAMRTRVFGPEHLDLAPGYECLGNALNAQSRLTESVPNLREALRRYEIAGDSLKVADCAQPLSVVTWRGSYVEGEALLRRALRIYREVLGPENGPVADCLNGLGQTYHRPDPAVAEQFYRESLAMRLKVYGEGHGLVIQSRGNIATILAKQGRLEEAEMMYREIISGYDEVLGKDHHWNAIWYHNLSWTLWRQGRLDEATEAVEHAIELRRAEVGDHDVLVTNGKTYLAWITFERGDYERAEALFSDVVAKEDGLKGPTNRHNVRNLEMLGLCAWAKGDLPKAEDYLVRSTTLFERVRLMAARGFGRSTFMPSPYERLAAVRLELRRGNDAWTVVERVRGLTLSELLFASEARGLTRLEVAEEDSLAHALSDAEATLVARIQDAYDEQTPDAQSAVAEARHELLDVQSRWDALQTRLAKRYPVSEGLSVALVELQSTLADNVAVVGWLDADPTKTRTISWAYVIRHQGDVRWERLGGTEHPATGNRTDVVQDLNNLLIEQGRSAFVDERGRSALEKAAREAAAARFAALEKHLSGVEEIIVIPSRGMSGLPVECLVDANGTWVGERFAVSYAPSATIAVWLRERGAPTGGRTKAALLVGDPPFREEHAVTMRGEHLTEAQALASRSAPMPDESVLRSALDGSPEALSELPRLVASRGEVQGIASVVGAARVLVGEEASESAIAGLADTGELERFDIVHFATHALVDNEQPERSALVMSQLQARGDEAVHAGLNGLITAAEVVRLWDLDAELVTLSGCRTALGKSTAEGTLGLVNAFLQAGGRCMLVSLWDVDDEATALLMQRFYETWIRSIHDGDPISKGEALRRAKAWLRRYGDSSAPFDHPYYWSAFVLVGDAR